MKIEQRSLPCELRAAGRRLEGYAATFDNETVFQGVREVIKPGAFRSSLIPENDILALLDHDPGKLLARTRSNTLRLSEDTRGLHFDIDLPSTNLGRDTLEMAQRSDLGGMSFGFFAVDDPYIEDVRELRKVNLFEISIVQAHPAYQHTVIQARSKLSTHPRLMAAQRSVRILEGLIK